MQAIAGHIGFCLPQFTKRKSEQGEGITRLSIHDHHVNQFGFNPYSRYCRRRLNDLTKVILRH